MSYNVTVSETDYVGIDKVELPITGENTKAIFYATRLEELICGSITAFESDLLQNNVYSGPYYFNRSSIFSGCTKLERVSLPKIIALPASTFDGCSSLKDVNIPLVDNINANAFIRCTALEKLDLPSVKTIGVNAFHKCTAMTALIIRTNSVCTLSNVNALSESSFTDGTGYIYVPSALIDSYKSETNWSTYSAQFRAIEDYPDICGQ